VGYGSVVSERGECAGEQGKKANKKCYFVRIFKTCKNRKCGLAREKAICHEMAGIAL